MLSDGVLNVDQLREAVFEALGSNGVADSAAFGTLVDFMSKTMLFLVLGDNRAVEDWNECILPYIKFIVAESAVEATAAAIYAKGITGLSAEKADPEDEEEDLCNATFSLAYGTRVLLHQTPFRVKIGRKYGLVGPNGAGKS